MKAMVRGAILVIGVQCVAYGMAKAGTVGAVVASIVGGLLLGVYVGTGRNA